MSLIEKSKGKLKYDIGYLENCSEIEVFIQVDCYYEQVKRYHEMLEKVRYYQQLQQTHRNIEDYSLADYFQNLVETISIEIGQYQESEDTLDYCILQTARFNTGVTETQNGRVEITPAFEVWYQNWKDYIQNMDDETLMFYRRCRYEGKGLEQFQLNQSILAENMEDTLNSPKIKQYHYRESKQNIRQKLA